jgi:5,10-methylenetetrahydromethanopterin reductase
MVAPCICSSIRAWLRAENGQRVRHDREFYQVDAMVGAPVLGRIDAPILLGAFNKLRPPPPAGWSTE